MIATKTIYPRAKRREKGNKGETNIFLPPLYPFVFFDAHDCDMNESSFCGRSIRNSRCRFQKKKREYEKEITKGMAASLLWVDVGKRTFWVITEISCGVSATQRENKNVVLLGYTDTLFRYEKRLPLFVCFFNHFHWFPFEKPLRKGEKKNKQFWFGQWNRKRSDVNWWV